MTERTTDSTSEFDYLDLYRQASTWTLDKVAGAVTDMDASTTCDPWTVRQLMNHMLETQRYFVTSARGGDASPPSSDEPPVLLGGDPVADFRRARDETIETFAADGVIEKTGPSLGIAFGDALLHGWDLAKATGQDTTMPEGLAEAAYATIHGQFTDDQRQGVFAPEVEVPARCLRPRPTARLHRPRPVELSAAAPEYCAAWHDDRSRRRFSEAVDAGRDVVKHTPVVPSVTLSEMLGGDDRPQGREPATHGRVQDPRRDEQAGLARRRGEPAA